MGIKRFNALLGAEMIEVEKGALTDFKHGVERDGILGVHQLFDLTSFIYPLLKIILCRKSPEEVSSKKCLINDSQFIFEQSFTNILKALAVSCNIVECKYEKPFVVRKITVLIDGENTPPQKVLEVEKRQRTIRDQHEKAAIQFFLNTKIYSLVEYVSLSLSNHFSNFIQVDLVQGGEGEINLLKVAETDEENFKIGHSRDTDLVGANDLYQRVNFICIWATENHKAYIRYYVWDKKFLYVNTLPRKPGTLWMLTLISGCDYYPGFYSGDKELKSLFNIFVNAWQQSSDFDVANRLFFSLKKMLSSGISSGAIRGTPIHPDWKPYILKLPRTLACFNTDITWTKENLIQAVMLCILSINNVCAQILDAQFLLEYWFGDHPWEGEIPHIIRYSGAVSNIKIPLGTFLTILLHIPKVFEEYSFEYQVKQVLFGFKPLFRKHIDLFFPNIQSFIEEIVTRGQEQHSQSKGWRGIFLIEVPAKYGMKGNYNNTL